ncbi:MAG: ferritin-like domain-containing protein [Terriglobales bacterium]
MQTADWENPVHGAAPDHGRRRFLKQVSAGAGALAVAGAAAPMRLLGQSTQPVTDADILNFALNLEYLEANFYTVATTGKTIDQLGIGISGAGTQGAVSGGHIVQFSDMERLHIAEQIANDEQAHVKLLRAALGSAAVAQPAINLDALGVGFDSQAEFLTLARAFEDTGVSAYGGAALYIQNKTYLSVAARILSIENQHTANIRFQLLHDEVDNGGLGPLDNVDIQVDDYRFFSSTYQGLSVIRSPRQVLDIVFHCTGCTSGGFYPNGVNSSNLAGLAAVPTPDEYIA